LLYKKTFDQINLLDFVNFNIIKSKHRNRRNKQKTFDNLQKIKGHEHDCGRPGINGGYIANPEVKFGVNCFGNKPRINEQEEELMKTVSPYPQTKEDLVFQKRVDYWKGKVDEILVSPFNYTSWGQL
jgi:hypothetical protein